MDAPQDFDIVSLRATLTTLLGKDVWCYPTAVEAAYPRILARIVELWGKPELDAYFDELMVPERTGRQGFDPAVAREIFHLSTVHGALGLRKADSGTGWSGLDDPALYRKAIRKEGG